jgi:hypothetical protein
MFKQPKSNLLFGGFFLVIAVLFLLINRWVDAAWSALVGGAVLFSIAGQKYPRVSRGPLGWAIVIVYIVVLVAVTILKLRTP